MSKKNSASSIVSRLQNTIRGTLSPLLPEGRFALVDYPNHSNVGDSAIWLGEVAYLEREMNIRPSYCCDLRTYSGDALADNIGAGTILIHGGGNFGTIWRKHQDFRIHLMERFPDNRIIQLPQSIHFDSDDLVPETARAIGKHKAFTLLVRDKQSYDFAKAKFDCPVHLCPDLAFYIGQTPRAEANVDLLYLLRTDGETIGNLAPAASKESMMAVDWLIESNKRIRLAALAANVGAILRGADYFARRKSVFDAMAWQRYRRGTALLSRGRVVITDRLHAHILSILLDIPNVVLDNSYGKLSTFITAWTADLDNLRQATDMEGALRRAQEILS